jgi:2,4-dienoyl-CoA reductase-like NADH-dependent reductase (Old Yellow Enzyme family)
VRKSVERLAYRYHLNRIRAGPGIIYAPMQAATGTRELTNTRMLLRPITIRDLTMRNRIGVSPMCQYSAEDGFVNDWHLVHLGSRAAGGAGLVIMEATAVEPRGRISLGDTGIWKDEHVPPLTRIASFIREHGAAAGIQLAHAGRKASVKRPWEGGGPLSEAEGAWQTVAPSPIPFHDADPVPHELTREEIAEIVAAFGAAAQRALQAGFELVEIHGAHGYLINEFLSPLSNHRTDEYGGSFENRIRFALEVTKSVREVWPARLPLFFRISATDWVDRGWTVEDSVGLARRLKALGVDLIDCSSGGNSPLQKIPATPGYQVPFAERIRKDAGIATAAVGLITKPEEANAVVTEGKADIVLLARKFLRDPYFPLQAAIALGEKPFSPIQYARAF